MRTKLAIVVLLALAALPGNAHAIGLDFSAPYCDAQRPSDIQTVRSGSTYLAGLRCFGRLDAIEVVERSHIESVEFSASPSKQAKVRVEPGYEGVAYFTFIPMSKLQSRGPLARVQFNVRRDQAYPPSCTGDGRSVRPGVSRRIPIHCLDTGLEPVDIEVITGPEVGSVVQVLPPEKTSTPSFANKATADLVYKAPPAGETPRQVEIGLRVTDREGQVGTGRVVVGLIDATANTAPTCKTDTAFVYGSNELRVPACTDADGDPIAIEILSGPEHGTLAGPVEDPDTVLRFGYLPDVDYVGEDEFTYIATDDQGASSAPARWRITVRAVPSGRFVDKPPSASFATTALFTTEKTPASTQTALQCKLDDGPWVGCGRYVSYTGLSVGGHTATLRVIDEAGGVRVLDEWFFGVLHPLAGTNETSGPVPPGEPAFVASSHEPPTEADPFVASVAVPAGTSGGVVTLLEQPNPTGAAPPGFLFVGQQLQIEAPAATAESPLRMTFLLDATALAAAGLNEQTVAITRDGVAVGPCDEDSGGWALPDPCVTDRYLTEEGDAVIDVLTSHASKWNFAKASDAQAPQTTIVSGPSATTDATTASFVLQADEAATFECSLDGGSYAPCPSTPTFTGLSVGPHSLKARAIDAAANVDASPAEHTWRVRDTTAPVVTLSAVAGQKPATVARDGLKLTLGCDEACFGLAAVTMDGKVVGAEPVLGSGLRTVTIELAGEAAGKLKNAREATLKVHTVVFDAAGNPATKTLEVKLRR